MIVDLTPVVDGVGPARLLDLVAGRSAAAMTDWITAQTLQFRRQVEVVAMDGFGGYRTAATSAVPDAVTVMYPFHVVALARAKLDACPNASKRKRPGLAAAAVIRSVTWLVTSRSSLPTPAPTRRGQGPVRQRDRHDPGRGPSRARRAHHARADPAAAPC